MRREVTLPPRASNDRDAGKIFRITEMSAERGEDWAVRALCAIAHAGVDIPDNLVAAGWSAVAFYGINSILRADYAELKPLLAEMMTCVSIVEPLATRALMGDDIEEIATRVYLRDEVFRLHANFSFLEILSMAGGALGATDESTSNTQTSQDESQTS